MNELMQGFVGIGYLLMAGCVAWVIYQVGKMFDIVNKLDESYARAEASLVREVVWKKIGEDIFHKNLPVKSALKEEAKFLLEKKLEEANKKDDDTASD